MALSSLLLTIQKNFGNDITLAIFDTKAKKNAWHVAANLEKVNIVQLMPQLSAPNHSNTT